MVSHWQEVGGEERGGGVENGESESADGGGDGGLEDRVTRAEQAAGLRSC